MASTLDFNELLRTHNMRATAGRLELLALLESEEKPLTVEEIKRRLPSKLNTVTLYRALESLKEARIVDRMDLQHGHAHYELIAGRPHHHHAVCRSCGTIEDIEIPHVAKPEKEAECRAKTFSIIDSYTLEFFGLCTRCA